MKGRESKIARAIFSNEENRRLLATKINKNQPIVGVEVKVDNKKYIISEGNASILNERVALLKRKYRDEYRSK